MNTTLPWSYSRGAEISEINWEIQIYHPKIALHNVYLHLYMMETTSVTAALNAMALTM